MSATSQRLNYIDSLRGLAAVGVVTVHSAVLSGNVTEYTFFGQRGVQLFYIISAFTLFLSLKGRQIWDPAEFRNFYLRRFFRVAPLYYVAIAANCLYQKFSQEAAAPLGLPAFDIVLGLSFLNGWNARTINSVAIGGWSVAVEATFYLLLPLIYLLVKNLRSSLWFFGVSSLATYLLSRAASAHFEHKLGNYFEFLWFPIQLPVFSLGIVLYFLRDEFEDFITGNGPLAATVPLRSWSLLCLMASGGFIWAGWPTRDQTLFISSIGLFFMIIALSLHPWKIFVNFATIYLGKISYSIYLSHFFVVIAFEQLLLPKTSKSFINLSAFMNSFAAIWLVILVGAVVVGTITYHAIEAPCLAWGRRFISKLESKSTSREQL